MATSNVNNTSITHHSPICHNGDIPEAYKKDFDNVKLCLSVDGRSPQYLFGGFRYPMDKNKLMVLANPLDYFAPGYKGCSPFCRLSCEKRVKDLISNVNDHTIEWGGRDTCALPLWMAEYKDFCRDVGSDFHPKTCYCGRCYSMRKLLREFRYICPHYYRSFDAKYNEVRKNVAAAIQSGIGLDYVTNPIFPFLSYRMLQQLAKKVGLNASCTSGDLMSSHSMLCNNYEINEII